MLPLFEEYTGKMWPDKIYLSCFAELNAAEMYGSSRRQHISSDDTQGKLPKQAPRVSSSSRKTLFHSKTGEPLLCMKYSC